MKCSKQKIVFSSNLVMMQISTLYVSKPPWIQFAGNIIAITGVNGCCLQQTFRFNHSTQLQQIQIQTQFVHITNTKNHNRCTKVKIFWLSKNDVLCDCARCNGSWRCAARKPAISLSKGARPLKICEPITKNICHGGKKVIPTIFLPYQTTILFQT